MHKTDPQNDYSSIPEPGPATEHYQHQGFDALLHTALGPFTGWLSPASFGLAAYDWFAHLNIAPAKQWDLAKSAYHKTWQFIEYTQQNLAQEEAKPCSHKQLTDARFKGEPWQQWPFNIYAQGFLLCEAWWQEATTTIRGVTKHHTQEVNFVTRQTLDIFSPSNCMWTNPDILTATWQEKGSNLIKGYANFLEDCHRLKNKLPPAGTENFQVGVNVAVTPGKVVYHNHLIELIQYTPTTEKVYAEPILITPAWIMKYYILDLSPENSLVKYLVDQGHTVFMISWKNPTTEDWDVGLDDYLHKGIFSALDVINKIIPQQKIHTVGYCLGGTLLTIAAAALASKNDDRLKTVTLFAAQVDFKDAGELQLFIDPSQISYLEDVMWVKGYLDGQQMAGAFNMLQSNRLIWSRMIFDYLLGKRSTINDLMAWNTDTTRLPFRMHSEYLHHLFLNNDLTQGRFKVDHKKIALLDVQVPMFVVSTLRDHVSPWRSVYKIHLFTDTDLTFVLTSGGHNAGIVSNTATVQGKNYQIKTRHRGDKYITSETWQERAEQREGSWWPSWQQWLAEQSGDLIAPPSVGNKAAGYPVLKDAPGDYVLEK